MYWRPTCFHVVHFLAKKWWDAFFDHPTGWIVCMNEVVYLLVCESIQISHRFNCLMSLRIHLTSCALWGMEPMFHAHALRSLQLQACQSYASTLVLSAVQIEGVSVTILMIRWIIVLVYVHVMGDKMFYSSQFCEKIRSFSAWKALLSLHNVHIFPPACAIVLFFLCLFLCVEELLSWFTDVKMIESACKNMHLHLFSDSCSHDVQMHTFEGVYTTIKNSIGYPLQ